MSGCRRRGWGNHREGNERLTHQNVLQASFIVQHVTDLLHTGRLSSPHARLFPPRYSHLPEGGCLILLTRRFCPESITSADATTTSPLSGLSAAARLALSVVSMPTPSSQRVL